jgi:predicted dehydrogenase
MSATRIGLVGFGEIARKRHFPAIAENPAFRLAAVADPAGHAPPDVAAFRAHADMLARMPDVDAVVVCTPPAARLRVALDAIAAGKHVLIEKPPTATVAEANVLTRAAAQAGVVLYAAWHSQENATVDLLREHLAGVPVARIDMVWSENFEQYHPGQQWIWRPGGFGILDAGINGLSILTRVLPHQVFVAGADAVLRPGDDTPIAMRLHLGPAGKAVMDWRAPADCREIRIRAADGRRFELLDSGRRLLIDGEQAGATARGEYPRIYERFAELLRAGASDADIEPLILACDALALARRVDALDA